MSHSPYGLVMKHAPFAPLTTLPDEARLTRLASLVYPVWRTILISVLVSVGITATAVLLVFGLHWFNLAFATSIATICSIIVSCGIVYLFEKYQQIILRKNNLLHTLAEQLQEANEELIQANEELDAFAHTVAHDLKNPLSNVLGYADYILEDPADVTTADLVHMMGKIAQSGREAISIVEEILLLSSTRADAVKTSAVDMSLVIERAMSRLHPLQQQTTAEIELPAQTWPVAIGYAPWLEEVWTNYLSNAIKYGGEPPRLTLGAEVEGRMVRFWVQDNGRGLTAEEQAQLFTQFTRLHQTRAEGHGLGLSIVQRIITKLGGEVGVRSTPGTGSQFYFTLPRPS